MGENNNFILGNGEKLTDSIKIKKSGGDKNPPYKWTEAKSRVGQWLNQIVKEFEEIPSEASPNNEVSAVITMHPRYTSKSDFPKNLLDSVGIRAVGGRSRKIKPESWGIEKHPEDAVTDEIIVVGTRQSFDQWAENINNWSENIKGRDEITHLENIKSFKSEDKIRDTIENFNNNLYEFVLHEAKNPDVLKSFERFVEYHECKINFEKIRFVGDLAFVPVYSKKEKLDLLAQFTYVRVLRSMPQLRTLKPKNTEIRDKIDIETNHEISNDSKKVIDNDLRVAIFDGGIPSDSPILKWVNLIEPRGIGKAKDEFLEHGLGVTSALLFGSLNLSGENLLNPIFMVDHIRVLDDSTGTNNDFELYDVLDRILYVLDEAKKNNKSYDFINLSIGPNISMEDDDINSWTAAIDQRLIGNETFVTVAAGNSGEGNANLGKNRIQPPSDAVNVLTVGSCDVEGESWKRAAYSSVGPGRCPGIVKPDGVVFGGSQYQEFMVLAIGEELAMIGTDGTSFAAPSLLRSAITVRSHVGSELGSLANRALFIHKAHRDTKEHNMHEVGWGRFETDLSSIITCEDDEVLVIFQGELPVGEHLRAPIPMPEDELKGMITITSTLVISPEIDPSYPNTYTRAGLEITFRPNAEKRKLYDDGNFSQHPESVAFFNKRGIFGETELNLREDGHKWEPCLKAQKKFRSASLLNPFFDIYYHNRQEGQSLKNPKPIPYALIVSVKAPKMKDFYNEVVRAYSNILIPLKPELQIKIS